MVSIEQQVAMWNKFISMNEEYVVMYNDEEGFISGEPFTWPLLSVMTYLSDGKREHVICMSIAFEDPLTELLPHLILYSLTSLDPQQELSMLDRGER